MHPRDQTIFALSSGRPPSAIALVRVSGPQAGKIVTALAGKLPSPRVATRVLIRDVGQRPIDDAVVLWFPGPASATGEDVAEFHVHGGRAVLASLFAALSAFEDVRPAEPGEFTRRAFENGKLDLTEAEGLDDLIHADTDRQRRQALRQLKGLLGDRARDWRARIIEASALIEAGIDFSDEGDVPAELIAPALAKVKGLLTEIEEVLAGQGRSERLRDGLVVAIAGPPNVGKSTLMNSARAPRGRDRVAACRHHARCYRGAARSRRLSGDGDRHRGYSRDRRPGRAGGCSPRPCPRGGCGPCAVAGGLVGSRDGGRGDRAGLAGAQQDRSRGGRSAIGRVRAKAGPSRFRRAAAMAYRS